MYFAMRDPNVPLRYRISISGALAYLILPLDVIPDLLPGVGLSDDAGIIAATIALVSSAVTSKHKKQAREFLDELGDDFDDSDDPENPD